MTESQENATEQVVSGDAVLEMARKCPLVIPVDSGDYLEAVLPQNKTHFKLKELYALLGCDMIEVVELGDTGMIFIIDEEGAINGDPQLNEFATVLWRHHDPRAAGQYLFGKVLLCPTEYLR